MKFAKRARTHPEDVGATHASPGVPHRDASCPPLFLKCHHAGEPANDNNLPHQSPANWTTGTSVPSLRRRTSRPEATQARFQPPAAWGDCPSSNAKLHQMGLLSAVGVTATRGRQGFPPACMLGSRRTTPPQRQSVSVDNREKGEKYHLATSPRARDHGQVILTDCDAIGTPCGVETALLCLQSRRRSILYSHTVLAAP